MEKWLDTNHTELNRLFLEEKRRRRKERKDKRREYAQIRKKEAKEEVVFIPPHTPPNDYIKSSVDKLRIRETNREEAAEAYRMRELNELVKSGAKTLTDFGSDDILSELKESAKTVVTKANAKSVMFLVLLRI
jgi:hypothetical protein